jgi:Arrestin (or S-antigen), C-terminal domain
MTTNCTIRVLVDGSKQLHDNFIIYAGDTLVGTICCDVSSPIAVTTTTTTGLQQSSLLVSFQGYEATWVKFTNTVPEQQLPNNNVTAPKIEIQNSYGTRNIISLQLDVPLTTEYGGLVVDSTGTIPVGEYRIPFEIALPASLPSSFEIGTMEGSSEIKYTIQAELKNSGVAWNYKSEVIPICITSNNNFTNTTTASHGTVNSFVPYKLEPIEQGVQSMCCFSRGTIIYAASMKDTRIVKEGTARVYLSIKNNTSIDIESIDARLVEYVTWQANGRRMTVPSTTLTNTNFASSFTKYDLLPSSFKDKDNKASIQQVCLQELEDGKHTGVIMVPAHAHPSYYHGSLIKITHEIVITFILSGKMLNSPTLHIPVCVNEKPPSSPHQPPETDDGITSVSVSSTGTIAVPSNRAILGGKPTGEALMTQQTDKDGHTIAPTMTKERSMIMEYDDLSPSIENLLSELENSLSDWDIIQSKLSNERWKNSDVFISLTPINYGKIIDAVDNVFDQPKIAQAIASVMKDKFTCAHVLAVLTNTPTVDSSSNNGSTQNRVAILENILPICSDLSNEDNKAVIAQQLSEWEKICLQPFFK